MWILFKSFWILFSVRVNRNPLGDATRFVLVSRMDLSANLCHVLQCFVPLSLVLNILLTSTGVDELLHKRWTVSIIYCSILTPNVTYSSHKSSEVESGDPFFCGYNFGLFVGDVVSWREAHRAVESSRDVTNVNKCFPWHRRCWDLLGLYSPATGEGTLKRQLVPSELWGSTGFLSSFELFSFDDFTFHMAKLICGGHL